MCSDTVELTKQLIACPSVTPEDAGCQDLIIHRLQAIGFEIEKLPFGDVKNFWARRGKQSPLLCFAGHTDVVPPGALDEWDQDPFLPTVKNGMLYGRGAADMKGSIAAMVTACERFFTAQPNHQGSIAFLITSDEEGPSVDGTVKVVEHLQRRKEQMDWCLVGEPSSSTRLGDIIKNGRRGSVNGKLVVRGIQGHVAYPHLGDNPIHRFAPALHALCSKEWDQGNDFFPPTSFQISNIHAGTGAENVIPGRLEVTFNLRFSTETSFEQIQQDVEAILNRHQLVYDLTWRLSGHPFLTPKGELIDATQSAVMAVTGKPAQLSTAGGTSDGRFIAPTGAQVVELGPLNASIHKVNEQVACEDLDRLSSIYEKILEILLPPL